MLMLSAMLVACGDDDDGAGGDASDATPVATQDGAASGSDGDGEAVAVNMIDFGYEPDSLTAVAGESMTLQLTNSGDLPHTFTIDGVVDSMEVAAGESAEITFTVEEAGTLTFFCTIHGAATMSGELTVS
jgi:plastocyanin